jgi:hypothetical protein
MARHKRQFGLLTKLLAVFLIAAASVPIPVNRAEAADPVTAAIEGIIIAMLEVTNNTMKKGAANLSKEILTTVDSEFYSQGLIFEQQKNQRNLEELVYDTDHEPLTGSMKVYENMDLSGLYGSLSSAAALSFQGAWSASAFGEASPGYRYSSASPVIIYSDAHEEMTEKLDAYAGGMMRSNHSEVIGLSGAAQKIEELEESVMEAGEFAEGGYRQIFQAQNQVWNHSNVQANRLRTDLTRRADSSARLSLDEIQRHTDAVSAFEQAVRIWDDPAPSAGY